METFPNSPGHQNGNAWCGNTARNDSFAFIRYLWLLFYGTVKAYHNLEVVFTLRVIVLLGCVLEHHTRGSCTKCGPMILLEILRNQTKAYNQSAGMEAT